MDIYLIRHTAVAVDKGVCYGGTDVALADSFAADAAATASVLTKLCPTEPTHWIASPATRCQRLTETLKGDLTDVQTDLRWWEMNFGTWEMQRWNDLPEETVRDWGDNYVHLRPPGGENFGDVALRVWKALSDVRELGREGNVGPIAVVAHGGSIRAALANLLSMPLTAAFRLQIDYGSVTHVRITSWRTELHVMNRLAHR
jgi:alpha-ribazole phosphatase